MNYQADIDEIHLSAKSRYEAKYQLLINKQTFLEYSNDMGIVMKY